MERASSEVLSVAQEAARLRKDTLSSSEDAQDCTGREWAQADPRLGGRSCPGPRQAPSPPQTDSSAQRCRDKSFSEGQRLSQPRRHPESSHQERGREQPQGPRVASQPPGEQASRGAAYPEGHPMEPPASPPCQAENGPMAASSPAVPQNPGLEGCHGWERGVGLRDGGGQGQAGSDVAVPGTRSTRRDGPVTGTAFSAPFIPPKHLFGTDGGRDETHQREPTPDRSCLLRGSRPPASKGLRGPRASGFSKHGRVRHWQRGQSPGKRQSLARPREWEFLLVSSQGGAWPQGWIRPTVPVMPPRRPTSLGAARGHQ